MHLQDGGKNHDTDHAYYQPTLAGNQLRMSLLQASRQQLNECIDSGNDSMEEGEQSETDVDNNIGIGMDGTYTGSYSIVFPIFYPCADITIKILIIHLQRTFWEPHHFISKLGI
jgi:hypothetical protein